jgi:hypothetical protein
VSSLHRNEWLVPPWVHSLRPGRIKKDPTRMHPRGNCKLLGYLASVHIGMMPTALCINCHCTLVCVINQQLSVTVSFYLNGVLYGSVAP